MRKLLGGLIIVSALVVCGCATPGKENFDLGQGLAKNNRWDEAITMYQDALAKEPKNPEYLEALRKAKEALSMRYMERVKTTLAQPPLTYEKVMSAYQEAEKALGLTPNNREAVNLVGKVKNVLDSINKKAEALYSGATKSMEKNNWAEAVKKLGEIKEFYPSYLDVALKLKQAEENGVSYYISEALKLAKTEDWEKVIKILSLAQEISPDRIEVMAGLKEARAKHNPDYYLGRAEECAKKGDWDMAIKLAQQVHNMNPSDDTAKRIVALKRDAAQHYSKQCSLNLSEKRLYYAYLNASKAIHYAPFMKTEQDSASILNKLLAAIAEKAASYEASGKLGNAHVWYEKIYSINPDYQDIFFKIENLKGKIRERIIKKIAIMDFTPPSGNPDAGKMVTDNLLTYITAHASSDVKILARDVLGAILKEIELGQAGLYDIESAKKAGKLKGTDVFIFGSVLNFKIEKDITEGYKYENVVVGKKSIPNPAYQTWIMSRGGRFTEKDMLTAPPATIVEEVRETVKYKIGTGKKRATVGVSFRVIDVEEGEVVITKTMQKSKEIKDDFSEGVSFANIKYDPLELPSDDELLQKVTQEVVAELSFEVLSRFQNPQTQYFNAAEMLKKKREYERAVEKYVDAIHVEEIKNISSPVSENAKKDIEQLLKQIS